MGFVSLGKQALEVRFKLCRGGNGDDADAEIVDIHLLKAFPVLAERLVNDDLFDEFVYKLRRQFDEIRDPAHLCDEHSDVIDLLLYTVQICFKDFDLLLKLRFLSLVFPIAVFPEPRSCPGVSPTLPRSCRRAVISRSDGHSVFKEQKRSRYIETPKGETTTSL